MKLRIVARTHYCLPDFLSNYGLDLTSVKFDEFRDNDNGQKNCVIIGDGRYIKKVLRFISSRESRFDFDWAIL